MERLRKGNARHIACNTSPEIQCSNKVDIHEYTYLQHVWVKFDTYHVWVKFELTIWYLNQIVFYSKHGTSRYPLFSNTISSCKTSVQYLNTLYIVAARSHTDIKINDYARYIRVNTPPWSIWGPCRLFREVRVHTRGRSEACVSDSYRSAWTRHPGPSPQTSSSDLYGTPVWKC